MEKKRSRRKPGARRYGDYSQETLNVVVDLVMSKSLSSYEAEKQFGIPRRTIINKCKNLHQNPVGRPQELSLDEERHIAEVVNVSTEFGSPLSLLDLRIVVYNYLEKNGKTTLFKGKMPGERWARNFLQRHNFTQRATQNIKRSRASKTIEEMSNYYENLESSIKDVPCENIMNFDETNLSDDPGSQKAIFKRGTKHPERVLNSSKSSVSIMFSVTADGDCLPPYVVYKAEHLWTRWCEFGPPKARYNRTKSGWFDMVCFDDWFKTIVLPWAISREGVKVIIGDNLSSHLSVEVVKLCEVHTIRLIFLPPNATHLTQPLDVAFFGPMKKRWREILLKYKLQNQNSTTINKCHFPQLLHELMTKINMTQSTIIRSGFAASGIFPFDPSRVLRKIPVTAEEEKKNFDVSLLEYLQRNRKSTTQPNKRSNKKLAVVAGKSISTEEVETDMLSRDINLAENQGIADKSKYKNNKGKGKTATKKHVNAEVNIENPQVLLQPKSLKELCTKFVHEFWTFPYEESKSFIHTTERTPTSNVHCLNQLSKNDPTNLPFTSLHEYDLPKCLQIMETRDSSSTSGNFSRYIEKVPHKIKILSDVIIKPGKSYPDKKKIIKEEKATIEKVSKENMNTLRNSFSKRKKKCVFNESSSLSSENSSVELCASDSDSVYETFDDYIEECLQEEKENYVPIPSEIPFGIHEIEFLKDDNKFEEGDWVLARFATKKSIKHYVGKIISLNNKIPTVKFLRRVKNSKHETGTIFTYPAVVDLCTITHSDDIISILPEPQISRRGQVIFSVDFTDFNIQ